MNCLQKDNLKNCPCSYPDCSRKGICCQCIAHHRGQGELPACYFSPEQEKSYDRSIEKFIQDQTGKQA